MIPLATLADSVNLANILVGVVAGVVGAVVGILTVGLRFGAWRQRVDDDLVALGSKLDAQRQTMVRQEGRLDEGNKQFQALPGLSTGVKGLTDQLTATTHLLRDLVTKEYCKMQHDHLERRLGASAKR